MQTSLAPSVTRALRLMAHFAAPLTAAVLPTSTPILASSSLATAASILQAGGLVAFPTETVYGLGASALSESAVAAIYTAKGRPGDNPLIVHVATRQMLVDLVPGGEAGIPAAYQALIEKFWPGPLSLIFSLAPSHHPPAKSAVVDAVRAGSPSVAIRMPSHPLALELIKLAGLPLAAPSANLSSRPSPTKAEHVAQDLGTGRGVGAILDGGDCVVGVESTVVDYHLSSGADGVERGEVRVLRAGGVSAEQIESCLAAAGLHGGAAARQQERVQVFNRDFVSAEMQARPTTPGMKYKHYSPSNSRVVLVQGVSGSAGAGLPSLVDVIASHQSRPPVGIATARVGLMLTMESHAELFPASHDPTALFQQLYLPGRPTERLDSYSFGSSRDAAESAQRLFAGLRTLDELIELPQAGHADAPAGTARGGVHYILLECIEEVGVGLAVMERARKAAGQSDVVHFRRG